MLYIRNKTISLYYNNFEYAKWLHNNEMTVRNKSFDKTDIQILTNIVQIIVIVCLYVLFLRNVTGKNICVGVLDLLYFFFSNISVISHKTG